LGKRGYTIPKSCLSKCDEEVLRKELFMKPETHGNYGGAGDISNEFPIYRESLNKMYLPRFYGISRYGMPTSSELSVGNHIVVPFEKPLRDYQDKIVDIYMNHVTSPAKDGTMDESMGSGAILEVPCGRGKCLAYDTPILMYDGTIEPVQNICMGDKIMGDDSKSRTVISISRGRETMYRVSITEMTYVGSGNVSNMTHVSDICMNDSYVVNESHILSLVNVKTNKIVDISVKSYLKLSSSKKDELRGYRVPIHFKVKSVAIDPYTFGYGICITNQMENTVLPYLEVRDLPINMNCLNKEMYSNYREHIPHEYKCNSRPYRMKLLAGIIDACGVLINDRYFHLYIESPTLLEDTIFVFRSVGFQICKLVDNTIQVWGNRNQLQSIPVKKKDNLFKTQALREGDDKEYDINKISTYHFELERLSVDDYYGFEIDGNRRFVLGDFTVTHNTVMALKIISLLEKKTLILVHKEFLMNQWIERIAEFLPAAKVGKIQADIFDVDGRDIVIGMIQTMYKRAFPANALTSFGLTVIDEVHRIGSEEFSKTLLQISTAYMLGISATVERKDGLTKLLYMFIGNKIYEESRSNEDPVMVRAIQYTTNDSEFNETEYDYKGSPKYSTMITKLCQYGPRSDFILQVLADLMTEYPENQVMVLAHNRSLLKYLFEGIQHRTIGEVGYYVGGMKQKDLQATESKQIVLATYAMAAEALDIKTLSTLVMVTPKTDIVQSVGRILRVKHDHPIIVDIVDSHELFQNQWHQRRRYYKSCNYEIRMIESRNYENMSIDWKIDKTWKRVFNPTIIFSEDCKNDGTKKSSILNKGTKIGFGKCMIEI
jgi:hypothetical protein